MYVKQVFKLLTLLAIVSSLAIAHGPQQPQDPTTQIQTKVKALGAFVILTDVQQQSMIALLTDANKATADMRTSMSAMRQELRKAVKANDGAAIEKIAAEIGALEGKVSGVGAKANAAIYALLTAEQKAKLDSATPQETSLRVLGTGLSPAPAPAPTPASAITAAPAK